MLDGSCSLNRKERHTSAWSFHCAQQLSRFTPQRHEDTNELNLCLCVFVVIVCREENYETLAQTTNSCSRTVRGRDFCRSPGRRDDIKRRGINTRCPHWFLLPGPERANT